MAISRRRFIQLSSLASASFMVPQFLRSAELSSLSDRQRKLVVVQLSGGNDGLNTIIPVRNDIYYKSRPQIGVARSASLSLSDDVGIHSALSGVKELYDQGYVSIINSVGYPNPVRSHFRSMDIWQTASAADEIKTTGWLGRYADLIEKKGKGANHGLPIEVDDTLSLAMKGEYGKGLAVKDVAQFYKAAKDPFLVNLSDAHKKEHDAYLADYLYKTLRETESSAAYLFERTKTYNSTVTYPNTAIGNRMKTIGTLINAHANASVYYVSHGSFDTHVRQPNRHERLLGDLDGALKSLFADLQQGNTADEVLIMIFSEFGRRVAQNASQGTDHGTASNMILISTQLKKKGLYNDMPNLEDLEEGDVRYQIDFKEVYATILSSWLQTNHNTILGQHFNTLDFI